MPGGPSVFRGMADGCSGDQGPLTVRRWEFAPAKMMSQEVV